MPFMRRRWTIGCTRTIPIPIPTPTEAKNREIANKAPHWPAIPLRSIAASELGREAGQIGVGIGIGIEGNDMGFGH